MTSTSSAPSRPIPSFRPPGALPPSLKTDSVPEGTPENPLLSSDHEPAQPPKRRKIESSSNTPSPLPSGAANLVTDNVIVGGDRTTELSGGPWRFSQPFLESFENISVQDEKPLALPTRPWQHPPTAKSKEDSKLSGRVRRNIPIPNTPDKIEAPVEACRFGKAALAGFCPWTGKHPEDVLSEPNVRQGYFDKTPNPPDKELGSAKHALFSVFKHRSGLETLSVVLGLALERKCKIGALSSTSNFRPPPRVTLTEAKRKTWLADLANADLPLKKLSRTIPQGIRGQSLLDQCLSNLIPTSRALWFIKCVGANEIRTLKRKGPGGAVTGGSETKWLKEWTSFVAQFLEGLLQKSRELDWNKDIHYAVGLTSQLYSEGLVDRDAFLDWILKAFAGADQTRTPFFLLLIQAYLPDILRFRRRSRKLASSLVEKLDSATKTKGDALLPLAAKLKSMIRALAIFRPVCFIMPEKWPQCKEILRTCLDLSNADQRGLLHDINLQNELTAASIHEQGNNHSTPPQAIIELLDQSKAPFHAKSIAAQCGTLCPNTSLLLSTILKWATSRYRASSHRVHLAARLLRIWDREGHDVENALFTFLADFSDKAVHRGSLVHLVAELSRSGTFSISSYLQTVIVRGGARPNSFVDSDIILKSTSVSEQTEVVPQICTETSQILTEISLQHLPGHVRSLRKLILARAGFRAEIEEAVIHHCQWFLSKRFSLANEMLSQSAEDVEFSMPMWSSLSWTVKCELSSWLRDFVKVQCEIGKESTPPLGARKRFSAEDLYVVRDILEKMGDLAVLADVLGLAITLPHEPLLASVVDTIDRHAHTFSAIGAFKDLQEKACKTYLTLRNTKLPLTTLTMSMLKLNGQYPNTAVSVRLLQRDLVQGDRGNAAAACSPFSDGVAESLQQAGSHFRDDFEAILQTETNMNAHMMEKLFSVLVERIEKQNLEGDHLNDLRTLCQLLARLRLCRLPQSTVLINAWIARLMREGEWRTTTALLVDLVGTGCLTFGMVMECARDVTNNKAAQRPALLALVVSLFASHVVESDAVIYRFETGRTQYITQHALEAVEILTNMKAPEKLGNTIQRIVESSIQATAISETLILSVADPIREYFHREADRVLKGAQPKQSSLLDGKDIMVLVDDFSYPLCKLSLRLRTHEMEAESGAALGEAFFATACNSWSSESSNHQWTALLSAAGPAAVRYVRVQAEEAFFASLPSFLQQRSMQPNIDTSSNSAEMATKYLGVAFAANGALGDQQTPSMTAQLIEKFSLIHRILSTMSQFPVSPIATTTPIPGLAMTPAAQNPNQPSSETLAAVSQYLPLLLRMTCLQRSSSNSILLSKAAQQEHIKLTVLLTTLALHPALKTTEHPPRILAVVSTLITQLQFTDDMHAYCAKLLKDKLRDPSVMFLFGSVNMCGSVKVKDVGEGLQLHKEGAGRVGEWKPWVRNWEVIEPSGGGEGSSWVGLGMFDARRV